MLSKLAPLSLALVLVGSLFAQDAAADVLIVRERNGKLALKGIKSKIKVDDEEIEITPKNVDAFRDHSTGVITENNYTGLVLKAKARDRTGKTYAHESIVRIIPTTSPDELLDGFDEMGVGNLARAIAIFKDVVANKEFASVHRDNANYQIGQCLLAAGKYTSATKHYKAWPAASPSVFTPEVFRILGLLHTQKKEYGPARKRYEAIAALPSITDDWKQRARLGLVRVAIAESAFGKAEREASQVVTATAGKQYLENAHVLALTLQGQAIYRAGKKDRFPEAETLLRKATRIDGPTDNTLAELYATLGDCLYAQGKLEEARFPYMRVVCLYPRSAVAASALLNAGQVLIDMSGRLNGTPADQERSDELLVGGMRLLSECGSRHRGSSSAARAKATWKANKARYEAITKSDS